MHQSNRKLLLLLLVLGLIVSNGVFAKQLDLRLFASQVLSLRTAFVESDPEALSVLSKIPGGKSVPELAATSQAIFENAVIKLGRLKSTAPVALYYNPLLDIAFISFWEKKDRLYRLVSIRILPGERLIDSNAEVPVQPEWMTASDFIVALKDTTNKRLATFDKLHPGNAIEIKTDDVTFAAAASDMRAVQPRLSGLLAMLVLWTEEFSPWLFSVVSRIDEILTAPNATTIATEAPGTDSATAAALSRLPSDFGQNLTLDMTLEIGKSQRLLIISLPQEGDIYVLVLCELDDTNNCALHRFILLSLAE